MRGLTGNVDRVKEKDPLLDAEVSVMGDGIGIQFPPLVCLPGLYLLNPQDLQGISCNRVKLRNPSYGQRRGAP